MIRLNESRFYRRRENNTAGRRNSHDEGRLGVRDGSRRDAS